MPIDTAIVARLIAIAAVASVGGACRESPPDQAIEAEPTPSTTGRDVPEGPPSVGPDPWKAAKDRGIEFRALGQEPGWYLEIDEGASMRLVYDYAEREATTPVPAPVVSEGTTIYEARTAAHHLRVAIEDRPCSDVMSGLRFPKTVTVTIDGNTYNGCGQDLTGALESPAPRP